ncbi:MAG: type VI secretion system baseplate subunit TssF [Pseudomonadota bacterium]
MNREFLEFYNRELELLYERAGDFAAEFPGVAERLGGLTRDSMDPGLVGLLEGCAFLAARVQLKLKSEFSDFTMAFLEQVIPNFLAPIPSIALVQAQPAYEDSNLGKGIRHRRGSYMDATYIERDSRVSCRFRLGRDLVLWPLHIEAAQYYASTAPLQALGLEVTQKTRAGLKLTLRRRVTPVGQDAPADKVQRNPIRACAIEELPIHIMAPETDAIALYEQLFTNCVRVTFRYLDSFGDPRFVVATPDTLQQVGFTEEERLFPADDRVFAGFELLREFFAFPKKFLGFQLSNLKNVIRQIDAPVVDVLLEFDDSMPRLASVLNESHFALHTVPVINLFEMTCGRVPIRRQDHEYHIVPDRSRYLDFEAHQVIDVFAHYSGETEKVRVYPLYSAPKANIPIHEALYFTVRRLPRRRTDNERRYGLLASYTGSELFLSLREPTALDDDHRVKELSVRCYCSNRHLTEHLPVGESGADFFLIDDVKLPFSCVAGPTKPTESIAFLERKQRVKEPSGAILWKLINILSLNHLGLVDRSPEEGADALRELIAIFADLSDYVTERRVRGIQSISSKPLVRRLRQSNGFNAARGIEITVTLDEKAFEGSGVFLLGALLDRFFAEYAAINSFTETVIRSVQRGEIKRWPQRKGARGLL